MIYEPAEDSELLIEVVKRFCEGKRVLEIGCGGGAVMEAALKAGALSVKGGDISKESVEFCRGKGLDVIESDLFERVDGKFDLIVFNPPYLPRDEREDSKSALATSGGEMGEEVIVRFLQDVGDYLYNGGKILLVVSSLTPVKRIEKLIGEKGFVKTVAASAKFFMEKLEVWEIRKP